MNLKIKTINKKNNYYQVVIENQTYLFSQNTILEFPELLKSEITHTQLMNIVSRDEYNQNLLGALNWSLLSPRSIYDTKQYLLRKDLSLDAITQIVEYLMVARILNDNEYAKLYFISHKKKHGLNKIIVDLSKKEILLRKDEPFLVNYLESDYLQVIIEKKIPTYKGVSVLELKAKLFKFSRSRGFSKNVILQIIEQLTKDIEINEEQLIILELKHLLNKSLDINNLSQVNKFKKKMLRKGFDLNDINRVLETQK